MPVKPDPNRQIILIDTNVILIDPSAYLKFGDAHVVLPLIVIEEIDTFKRDMTPIGKAAREFIRDLDKLRKTGKLIEGVALESGGIISVYIPNKNQPGLPAGLDRKIKDNFIIGAALDLVQNYNKVKIVTKDADLRIKADVLGLDADDYSTTTGISEKLYTGERELEVAAELINRFYQKNNPDKSIKWADLGNEDEPLYINEYITLKANGQSALGRCHKDGTIHDLNQRPALGIQARNREQHFAFDALLDPEISMVTLSGKAGTGKTLLAIACGLEQVLEKKTYRKILVARPIVPLGRDLGALPGELADKLKPWMQPIYDNLDYILGTEDEDNGEKEKLSTRDKSTVTTQYLHQAGLLSVEPLTYIRGRSIPEQYIVVDEAQNLSPHEARTIITRAGEGSKIVFTGDFYQIDHPYLNLFSNGISFTAERFKNQDLFAHVALQKGERSRLAEKAHELMQI